MENAEEIQDIPVLFFIDDKEWEQWLGKHFLAPKGVWLKFAKKDTGVESLHYKEALDVALCYGWIDGLSRRIDETYYVQKFTPRRKQSLWSKVNIGHVERLIAAGRMQPSGQAAIDAAKADGRWEQAYEGQKAASIPPELETALAAHPQAKAFFGTLKSADRYACIWRVATAKRSETKAARIEKIITMLENGQTFH